MGTGLFDGLLAVPQLRLFLFHLRTLLADGELKTFDFALDGRGVQSTGFRLQALAAAVQRGELAFEVFHAGALDLRTLRPLDRETVHSSLKKTNRLVAVEEGWPTFGLGAEMAALAMEEAFDYLDAPVVRVTGKDVPMPYAANLEKLALPQTGDVVKAAKQVCYR